MLLVLTSPASQNLAFGQSNLRYEISGGYHYIRLTQGVFSNWENQWFAGVGLAYNATPAVQLVANAAYYDFHYVGGNVQFALPDIVGIRARVSGESSDVYELSFAARFIERNRRFTPFLSLRSGAYMMDIGKILVSTYFEQNPQNVTSYTYKGTDQTVIKAFGSLGLGFNLMLRANVEFQLESRFNSTFDGNQAFVPVISTFQFRL